MKVLCPKCDVIVKLSRVEKKSLEVGKCAKCDILIYASYQKDGGRQIWEVHMEKSATSKPKPKSEFWFWMLVLIIGGLLVRVYLVVSGPQ